MRRTLLWTACGLFLVFGFLPGLSAATAPPAEKPVPNPAQKVVTVTLVRWPYT